MGHSLLRSVSLRLRANGTKRLSTFVTGRAPTQPAARAMRRPAVIAAANSAGSTLPPESTTAAVRPRSRACPTAPQPGRPRRRARPPASGGGTRTPWRSAPRRRSPRPPASNWRLIANVSSPGVGSAGHRRSRWPPARSRRGRRLRASGWYRRDQPARPRRPRCRETPGQGQRAAGDQPAAAARHQRDVGPDGAGLGPAPRSPGRPCPARQRCAGSSKGLISAAPVSAAISAPIASRNSRDRS